MNKKEIVLGTYEIDRMLRFRDWLRSNDTDRKNTNVSSGTCKE